MDCREKDPADLAERFLGGRMDDAESTRYEEHFFACDSCFAELKALEALQVELVRTRPSIEAKVRVPHAGLWIAAVLVLASGAALYLARGGMPLPEAGNRKGSPIPASLARIEPSPWTPARLRGAESEADRRFREAMGLYSKGAWSVALPALREASRLDPEAVHVSFYLGVCALLAGENTEAVGILRKVVSLGETPFLEESRFYLAKAYLGGGDLAAAMAELQATVDLGGPRRDEARTLLEKLEMTRPRSP